ncbi:cytochrome b [Limoniibacter endophyticus]|uniref:Cytochrome b n=1 Tax=Limoniibacter endophyticus TaxID=1565040 RepID=A0A8J3DGG1_9HYPH|nr:cytochrome b [Limoniibacter endophyticus]
MRILHWLVACIVLATWPLGLLLEHFKDEVKLDFYLIHESLGFLVLWLMLLRVGFRLTSGAPEHERNWTGTLAATVHWLFYLALIIMPLSGFLATNAFGFPLIWFGIIPVWSPVGPSRELGAFFISIHVITAWAILGLFALHMAGFLYHHLIRRDATLQRIL